MRNHTHYSAHSPSFFNFAYAWREIAATLRGSGNLIKEFVKLDLMAQFKKTVLGNSWLVITPVLNLAIWLIMRRSGVFAPGATDIPYPAYLLLSLSLWTFFIGFFETLGGSITAAAPIITQVKISYEIIVAQKVLVNLANFVVPFLLSLAVILIYGVELHWASLLFPLTLVPLVLFGTLLGMLFAIVEVVAHDLFILFRRSLKLFMYLTPIVYSNKTDSALLQTIMGWNPLTYLIVLPRDVLVRGQFTDLETYLWVSGGMVVAFLLMAQFLFFSWPKMLEKVM